jgi:hypothetical protein
MHLGYSLTLGKRTAKLEKKNGHELEELKKVKKELQALKDATLSNLPKTPSSA